MDTNYGHVIMLDELARAFWHELGRQLADLWSQLPAVTPLSIGAVALVALLLFAAAWDRRERRHRGPATVMVSPACSQCGTSWVHRAGTQTRKWLCAFGHSFK
jgi:hypothetical protein